MTANSFTVRGTRNGSLVHVTWTDGHLTGDPPTVDLLQNHAEITGAVQGDILSTRAYPELASLPPDPLLDPASALKLITHVFDTIRETSGTLP